MGKRCRHAMALAADTLAMTPTVMDRPPMAGRYAGAAAQQSTVSTRSWCHLAYPGYVRGLIYSMLSPGEETPYSYHRRQALFPTSVKLHVKSNLSVRVLALVHHRSLGKLGGAKDGDRPGNTDSRVGVSSLLELSSSLHRRSRRAFDVSLTAPLRFDPSRLNYRSTV